MHCHSKYTLFTAVEEEDNNTTFSCLEMVISLFPSICSGLDLIHGRVQQPLRAATNIYI